MDLAISRCSSYTWNRAKSWAEFGNEVGNMPFTMKDMRITFSLVIILSPRPDDIPCAILRCLPDISLLFLFDTTVWCDGRLWDTCHVAISYCPSLGSLKNYSSHLDTTYCSHTLNDAIIGPDGRHPLSMTSWQGILSFASIILPAGVYASPQTL